MLVGKWGASARAAGRGVSACVGLALGAGAATLSETASAQAPAGASSSAMGELVVTGVRAGGSYPNGVGKVGELGVFGERELIDTPVSAKSFTGAFMADQVALTSNDLMQRDASFVPTVNVGLSGSDGGLVRGFRVFTYEGSFDGSANVTNRRVPLEMLERVDLLKGPSTFHSGPRFFGGVGGTINYVSKKPLEAPLTRLTALYGGGSLFGASTDMSRRFGGRGEYGVRLNLAAREGETQIDGVDESSRVAHLAFSVDSGPLALNLQYGKFLAQVDGYSDGYGYAPGVAIIAPADSSRFSGPDWAFSEYDYDFARAAGTWTLAEAWQAFASASITRHDEDFLNLQTTVQDASGAAVVTAYPQFGRSDWGDHWTTDVGVRGRFATGPLTHRITVAYGYTKYFEAFREVEALTLTTPTPVNVYDPDSFEIARPVLRDTGAYLPFFDNRGEGVLIADEIGFLDDRVLLTLGARRTRIAQDSWPFAARSANGRPTTSYDQAEWTPSAAVVVKPTSRLSFYANYLEALERGAVAPSNAANPGAATAPGVSEQIEAGAKADFGRWGATAAVFRIERPSTYLDPVSRLFGLFGRDRHSGVELDVFGEPLEGVRLYASFAGLDAEVLNSAGGALDGKRPISVPETVYAFGVDADVPAVPGLALRADLRRVGAQFYDAQNVRAIDAHTVVDAGLRYAFTGGGQPLTLRINVNNLLDEAYYPYARFNTSPGAPRTVRATLTAEF